jgi:hypothetical protein
MVRYVLTRRFREALRNFSLYELVVLADKLSENKAKWGYKANKIRNVVNAISANVNDEQLILSLEDLWGKKFEEEDFTFPQIVAFGNYIFGPLGLIASKTKRSKSETENLAELMEQVVGSKNITDIFELLKDELPKEDCEKVQAMHGKGHIYGALQVLLAYASDEIIWKRTNTLVVNGKIRMQVHHLYEISSSNDDLILTPCGFIFRERGDPVEKLRDLLVDRLSEEALSPYFEHEKYIADYPTKVLEFCIKKDPLWILTEFFAIQSLRGIAKEKNINVQSPTSDFSKGHKEMGTLILLKMGFNVPQELEGLGLYFKRLSQCRMDLSERSDQQSKKSTMTTVYNEMERVLKDLLNFYIGFLWQEEIEEKDFENTRMGVNCKLREIVSDPDRKRKSIDDLGFGDCISVLRDLNSVVESDRNLNSKLMSIFDRKVVFPKEILAVLNEVSPFRSRFDHANIYPGNGACDRIIDFAERFGRGIKGDDVFPSVGHTTSVYPCLVHFKQSTKDAYGRRYAKAFDENDKPWTIYGASLDPEKQYFMYSKTNPIAVNPVLVEKV